jgi:N-acetylmuramoyl-L-alanine amidase
MEQSKEAAAAVKDALIAGLGRNDKGALQQGLMVCRITQCPSILIETGFLSNPEEYEWLIDPENQSKMGRGIGEAVGKWLLAQ